jgi:hypothetical protein
VPLGAAEAAEPRTRAATSVNASLVIGWSRWVVAQRIIGSAGELAEDLAGRQPSEDRVLAFNRRHADPYGSNDNGKEAVPWIPLGVDHGAGLHDAGDCVRAYLVLPGGSKQS